MANLSVKDVPDLLAERLRQRAARNHRSLQGELMAIIQAAAGAADDVDAAPVAVGARLPVSMPVQASVTSGIGWGGRPVVRRGGKSIEQIAAEHRARFPKPVAAGPSSADIVRAERDAR